jgi:hypothetical protein
MRSHATTAQASYTVAGKATGSKGTGTFSGKLTTSGLKGTLAWKLTLSPAGAAASAAIRGGGGTGIKLASLCSPCSAGAHGSASLGAVALASVLSGRAGIAVVPKTGGLLHGAIKASKAGSGGGTITVPVTAATIAKGKAIAANNGCEGCHTIDGTASTGPTWKGLAGSTVHLVGGGTTKATDSYLIGVINDPSTLKVVGYDPNVMAEVIPPGKISKAQAALIVAYIHSVK